MEFPAVSMKKRAPTRKTKRTQSSFSKPEMEAALLLIQLSSDSDRRSSNSNTKSGDDFQVLIKGMDETQKQEEQSQGSCTNYNSSYNSEVASAMSATDRPTANNNGEDDENDVACGPRRRIKKLRSIDELYRLTKPSFVKLVA